MRRKIIIYLLVLFAIFASGATVGTLYMQRTMVELNRIVKLHAVDDLRDRLIIATQAAQTDLHTVHTSFERDTGLVVANVQRIERTASACSGCHHEPAIASRLREVGDLVQEYRTAIMSHFTAPTAHAEIEARKRETAALGDELLRKIETMSFQAHERLDALTMTAQSKASTAQMIMYSTVAITFFFGILVAMNLISSITNPVRALVKGMRVLRGGDLSYTIPYEGNDEFGELASHFNHMSAALRDGYVNLEREVHERQKTEGNLLKSEQFLSTIFDSIRDPFCIFDRTFTIVRVNEEYAEMKNASARALIGQRCFRVFHDKDRVCDDCVIVKTFVSGDPCAKERFLPSPEGPDIWQEIYTYPIIDKDGNVTHVIEYARDITERKRAEEDLRKSEERYALAAQGANDGLWDWDLNLNTVYFSPRWKAMLGYEEDEIGNTPEEWLNRVHPRDRGLVEKKISAHVEGHTIHFECEHRIRHKDGRWRWVLSRGLINKDAAGRVYRMAGSQTDVTKRKAAEERLLHEALHDALTELPNRVLFIERLHHALKASARRRESLFAVLFIDLDRFKMVNDSFGHTVGDQLLLEVSGRMSHCLREEDTFARFGGDEFAILIENLANPNEAVEVSRRILAELARPFQVKEQQVYVTASIGIALSSVGYELTEDILRDADIAMYQAKSRGKARYAIFDTEMHTAVVSDLQLETELRHAIQKEELHLHYQPIVDLETERLVGFEALARWRHPRLGLTLPAEFVPLAEETGLILDMGRWVLREACRQMSRWLEEHSPALPLRVSVNISSRQFSHPNLINEISEILRDTGLSPHSLSLEITESVIMENAASAASMLEQLKAIGVQVHIDDFGTGYSSLSYIHRFPISALKIDRSFVSEMSGDAGKEEIVKSIIYLAKNLQLDVIAEGLEMKDQLNRFRKLRCHYGQGYLFSRPLEPDMAERWIARQSADVLMER